MYRSFLTYVGLFSHIGCDNQRNRAAGGTEHMGRPQNELARYCNTLQHTLQHTATLCNTLQHSASATLCNTLQNTAANCHILPHTYMGRPSKELARYCNTLQHTPQHTATHYNTLQHSETLYNTLQQTATHCRTRIWIDRL